MATPEQEGLFRTADSEELVDYQPFSRLAIVSLLLGILSATALIQPLLWAVPAVAAALSLVAMRRIALSEVRLPGRGLAVAGLGLALLFGSWAPAWYLSRYYVLVRQARERSETWLELIRQGRLYEAHQLAIPHGDRARPGENLEALYTAPRPKDDADSIPKDPGIVPILPGLDLPGSFDQWRQTKPVDRIIALGKEAQFRFDRHLRWTRLGLGHIAFEELFVAGSNKDGGAGVLRLVIFIERRVDGDVAHWQVARVEEAEGPS